MADDAAWNQGWALGSQRAAEGRAHKQALSDQELEGKINELVDSRKAIQAKLPTLLDDKGQPTPEYQQAMDALTQNAQALRNIYHPQNNPSAVSKWGHVLTDMLHLTSPQQRQAQQASRQAAGAAQDVKTAQGLAAAAPVPPEQLAARQYTAQVNSQLAVIDKSNMPEEDKQRARDAVFRIYQKPNYKGYNVPGVGYRLLDTNDPESIPEGSVPYANPTAANEEGAEYQAYKVGGGTDSIDQWRIKQKSAPVRAWKKDANGRITSVLLDRQTNQPIPGSENANILPPPYLTARISTGVYHWTDQDNQIHETPESHTSSPVLPGGSASPYAGTSNPPGSGGQVQSLPRTTNPTAGGQSTPSSATGKSGDKVLGVKGSAPLNKAKSAYSDAVKIASMADDFVANPSSEKDALFVLSLIRSEAGRVNQQEIAQLFQAGGLSEAPERWAAKAGHGELSPNLRKQLQDYTKAQVVSAKKAVDALRSNPTDLKDQANKQQFPTAPAIGTVEDGDDGKHKYVGGDPAKKESWKLVTQ